MFLNEVLKKMLKSSFGVKFDKTTRQIRDYNLTYS